MRLIILFFLVFLLAVTVFVYLDTNNVYAHINKGNKTLAKIQEWKNANDNVKIQFSYSPEKPLIYTETSLIFSIQDLTTENHIKDLIANIAIIKDNKIFFKFNDVDIRNGDLSIDARFLEDGNYQVISQIRSTDNLAIALASFDIIVLLQPFGKFNADSLSSSSLFIPAGLIAIGLSISVIALILISRKRTKSENTTYDYVTASLFDIEKLYLKTQKLEFARPSVSIVLFSLS